LLGFRFRPIKISSDGIHFDIFARRIHLEIHQLKIMRRTLLITASVLLSIIGIQAQTIHTIEAGGGGIGNPDPFYSPQFIEIAVGDIVQWTNTGGTHNVDGTLETFPDNPVGFTSGDPDDALWVFEFTFDIVGFYEFECAAWDHAETQFGNITVVDPDVSIVNHSLAELNVYPNPSQGWVTIESDSD
jgi:plastocyanin